MPLSRRQDDSRTNILGEATIHIPKEIPKLENAVIYSNNKFVALVIANDIGSARETLENGINVKKTETFVYDEQGYPEYRTIFSLESGNEEIEMRSLIVTRDGTNEFISLYPRIKVGAIHEVEIDKIY